MAYPVEESLSTKILKRFRDKVRAHKRTAGESPKAHALSPALESESTKPWWLKQARKPGLDSPDQFTNFGCLTG
jgi:hypothetical protein